MQFNLSSFLNLKLKPNFSLFDLQVRSIDPYVTTYMDEYALLLKAECEDTKLNRLVHDLVNIDPMKAEVFVALSVLWETKDEKRALVYAEKVSLVIL